ncbi:MAG: molybdopterin-dependent oxidoreductase [Acidobacteriota bacterium]|nr:molybdopterin-dependent oxidoreductase [Pyrinomonadaceae bacterium]MDW8305173.1 molybdopterin-dependent oxidoreductase [Acidobacteriota bacterium]
MIKITINGQEFEVPKGARLIDVCREKGFGVPSFCYYSDLALQASCRMCLVRIEKMPKLQTACTIICSDGMVVTTKSEEIEKAQRAMGEFLLANHPLDCPVCDRGGECELQEMIFDWGDLEERFTERKNAQPEKYLSPMIANDPQRCILCKRCTRVCEEWMGEEAIEAGNRGVNTVIGTYGGWLNCSQCGNCVEVCPTGTLLDGVYRHETRPWELDQTVSTDIYGSDGMQISIGSRGGKVHRIVARDRYVNGLNGEFLDVKARFGHGFINHEDRLKTPLIRYKKGGRLIPATWDEAVSFVAEKLKTYGRSAGVIASCRLTNESIYTLKRFATDVLKTDLYAVSDKYDLAPFFDNLSAPLCTHKQIRYASTIILIGGEPEEEQTFTAKQIRQAVRNGGAKLVIINDTPIRLKSYASRFIHINPKSYDAFVLGLIDPTSRREASAKLGIDEKEFDALERILRETKGDLIIMFGGDLSAEAQAILANSAHIFASEDCQVLFHPLPLYNNSVGANDIMQGKKPLIEVLQKASALLIGGSLHEENTRYLESKEFIVVQELFETETTRYADVVFPASSFAEVDGTYTNNTGFVQRVRQAIEPLHQSKPDWMITFLIAREMGVDFGYDFSASSVFRQLADSIDPYNGIRYPHLKDESKPVQVKHKIWPKRDLSSEINVLRERMSKMTENTQKISETPRVGHKLHRLTTLTSKTPEFHLLAHGNPKPDNVFVSPLLQFNLDGTPRKEEWVKAVNVGDRE